MKAVIVNSKRCPRENMFRSDGVTARAWTDGSVSIEVDGSDDGWDGEVSMTLEQAEAARGLLDKAIARARAAT